MQGGKGLGVRESGRGAVGVEVSLGLAFRCLVLGTLAPAWADEWRTVVTGHTEL